MLVQKRNKPWESINYILNLDDNNAYSPTKYFFIFFFYFLFGGQISLGGCCYLILYINIYTRADFLMKKKKKKIF